MDPSTGTFISMDSYQGSIYDPVSLHKYLYANVNPVMYTDPTGYFFLAEFSIADGIQSTLSSMHQLNSLRNIIKWAAVGAVVSATDSYLGGNDFAKIVQDAFKGAFLELYWDVL